MSETYESGQNNPEEKSGERDKTTHFEAWGGLYIAAALVAGVIGIFSYIGLSRPEYTAANKKSFSDFGVAAVVASNDGINLGDISQIAIGDLDGDGDNDIVVGTSLGTVITLENRMNEARNTQPE